MSDLRSELVSLARRPGEAISEAEIALSYGVSRTPVREAILKLSDEGLLEIFPQSGIIVSRIPVAELPEAIIIRKALEETTARLAAERATASQILALRAILERQREADAAKDGDAFHAADEAFHSTIAEIARHPGIWKLIQQVKVHVDRYRLLTLPQIGRIARSDRASMKRSWPRSRRTIRAGARDSRWIIIWKICSTISTPRRASIRSSSTKAERVGKTKVRSARSRSNR